MHKLAVEVHTARTAIDATASGKTQVEVASQEELDSLPFWMQGDAKFNSNAIIQLRAQLRHHPDVVAQLHLWWETAQLRCRSKGVLPRVNQQEATTIELRTVILHRARPPRTRLAPSTPHHARHLLCGQAGTPTCRLSSDSIARRSIAAMRQGFTLEERPRRQTSHFNVQRLIVVRRLECT